MSFLLDALGKADHDRRRSEVPELRTYNQAARSPVRSVLRAFGLLSLLLLCFALGYFLRPFLETTLLGRGEVSDRYPSSKATEKPADIAAVTPPAQVVAVENVPQNPVRRAFELEVISYSDSPAARFVMINGAVLHEGEVLGSGELLLTIEPDAVVLEQAGKQIRIGM